MKKILVMMAVAVLMVGCATNSDVEGLQSQVDGLKTSVAQVSSDASTASVAAADASNKAAGALVAANEAEESSKAVNVKLDTLFKQAMTK